MDNTKFFFILGVGKAGTTSLYHYLNQHPKIQMSITKEPHFFECEPDKNIEYYKKKYFGKIKPKTTLLGDATPTNSLLPTTLQRISKLCPGSKSILILRNPSERAISLWWMHYQRGIEKLYLNDAVQKNIEEIKEGHNFDSATEAQKWCENLEFLKHKRKIKYRTYLQEGLYPQQIKNARNYLKEENVKIILLEDLANRKIETLQEICSFLEIETDFKINSSEEHNLPLRKSMSWVYKLAYNFNLNPLIQKIPYPIKKAMRIILSSKNKKYNDYVTDDTRKILASFYLNSIKETEILINRDLTHWINS